MSSAKSQPEGILRCARFRVEVRVVESDDKLFCFEAESVIQQLYHERSVLLRHSRESCGGHTIAGLFADTCRVKSLFGLREMRRYNIVLHHISVLRKED